MPKIDLDNKVVLLIMEEDAGKDLAISLAERGADVALAYDSGWTKTAVQIKKHIQAIGRRCQLVGSDKSHPHFIERTIDQVVGLFGQMDIFIDLSAPHPSPS